MKTTSKNWKLGVSSRFFYNNFSIDELEKLAKANINVIEASFTDVPRFEKDGKTELDLNLDLKYIKNNADAAGIELWSLHIPYSPFKVMNPSSLDKEVRKKAIEIINRYFEYMCELEISTAVIHSSVEPNLPENRAEHIKCAKESFYLLAKSAQEKGITIAVEDLPRTCIGNCSDEILSILEADSSLRVCFDANHLLLENPIDFIKKVGNKIVTTHISDYDFLNEKHWLCYEGKNDWNKIVTALENSGYNGPWLYEINSNAPQSISRPRDLSADDLRENFEAIKQGKPAKIFGTPNLEFCLENAYIK